MKWLWLVVMGVMIGTPAYARKKVPPDPLFSTHVAYQPFLKSLAESTQQDAAALERIFNEVRLKPQIIRAISRPAEAKPWDQYRPLFVNEKRVLGGVTFWDNHAAALLRARKQFDVPESMITAIIGVETVYGRNTGSFRVLDALTTLAVDYPPRSDFFRRELEQYLTLAQEHAIDPLSVKGSYAGAMGIGQFMPSSYRKYGIDFDGDGHPDLWGNTADAIGSVANYFKSFGWKMGEPVVVPVEVKGEETREFANTGWTARKTVEEWQRRGVVLQDALWPQTEAMLVRLDTASGPQFWLGFNNYYVITRYNRSLRYALAVWQLSQEIETARRSAYSEK
ncbi:MAG: lytic murein transglycosylase B [Burkholderiales bacterium]|nr:lytic murein transglycosylase B [Burkholderiales bacterium]